MGDGEGERNDTGSDGAGARVGVRAGVRANPGVCVWVKASGGAGVSDGVSTPCVRALMLIAGWFANGVVVPGNNMFMFILVCIMFTFTLALFAGAMGGMYVCGIDDTRATPAPKLERSTPPFAAAVLEVDGKIAFSDPRGINALALTMFTP